eukprot:gene8692-10212_t
MANKKKTTTTVAAKKVVASAAKKAVVVKKKPENIYEAMENRVSEINESPELFLDQPSHVKETMTDLLVKLYNLAKKSELITTDSLDEVLVEGFDNEQIWSQIQLFNDPIISHLSSQLRALLKSQDEVDIIEEDEEEEDDMDDIEDDFDEYAGSEDELDDDEDDGVSGEDDEDDDETLNSWKLGKDGEPAEYDYKEQQALKRKEKAEARGMGKKKNGEINFFKQEEMERFLDDADDIDSDLEDEDADVKDFELGSDDDDEDDGGLVFAQGKMDAQERALDKLLDKYMEEEEGSSLKKKEKKKVVKADEMKFNDFFANPEDGDQEEGDDEEFPMDGEDDFDEEDMGDDMDGEDDDDEDGEDDGEFAFKEDGQDDKDDGPTLPAGELSNFEKKAKQIQDRILELERANLKKKNWTVIGEASSKDRPVNSLLEEKLDYEHAQRVAPVITEETNKSLEEIIKKRILEKNFDDVIRKTEQEFVEKFKSKMELNDEKNTEGLSSVYEKDFMSKAMGIEMTDEVKTKHDDIKQLMDKLMYKLNAFSSFNFTPKRIKDRELNVTKAQAITMEEKVPTAASTSTLQAPEEVYFKKIADEKGLSEYTKSDRKNVRGQIKKNWRNENAEAEAKQRVAEKIDPTKANKHSTARSLAHLKQQRNVTIVDNTKAKFERSGQFFAKIQTEQDNKRKGITAAPTLAQKKAKSQQDHASANFKL